MSAAVAAHVVGAPPAESRLIRFTAVLRRLSHGDIRWRLRCLLLGHEDAFARQPGRLHLRCVACGRETVGWTIGPGAPPPPLDIRRRAAVIGTTAAVASALLLRPWTRWWARRGGRDRQRLRMVVAAERAASHGADRGGPFESLQLGRSWPRTGEHRAASRARAGFGDYGRSANGASSPAGRPMSLRR